MLIKNIKKKLHAKTIAVSTIPQKNGKYIIMERCEMKDGHKITIIHEEEKAVILCEK